MDDRSCHAGGFCRALSAALAVVAAFPAFVAAQPPASRIEVIGSRLPSLATETAAPVDVITRQDLERSGHPSLAEALRMLPATSNNLLESFANSMAPGAAAVSLRGLGQRATLVLVNGRRVASYGFAQNGTQPFVDLNAIPLSAIERVELLRDGASAIYGSDAIAGVVNVVLRRDFHGTEGSAALGRFDGTSEGRASVAFGSGTLERDGFNAFGVLDYFGRGLLQYDETDFGRTRDMRHVPGGRNHQSLTAGGTWRQLNAAGGTTTIHRAITECPGDVIDGPEAVRRGLIASTLGNAAFNAAGNTFCAFDANGQITALPRTQRWGFTGRAAAAISGRTTASAEVGLFRNATSQTFSAATFAGATASAGPVLPPFTYNVDFAPGVAGNPFSSNARYVGMLADVGTRDQEITSHGARLLAGVTSDVGEWEVDAAALWSGNDTRAVIEHALSLPGVAAAFGVGSGPQPPVPLSRTSTYQLDRWSANSPQVRDSVLASVGRDARSRLALADIKASRELAALPAGPAGLVLGAEWRRESIEDVPDERTEAGAVLGTAGIRTSGARQATAAFAEIGLPLASGLHAQAALRHDRHAGYGASTSPKVGLKWHPGASLLLRGSWGRGFRAPSLQETSHSGLIGAGSVSDASTPPGTPVTLVVLGNPALDPERSASTTAGLRWEPVPGVSVGVDLYDLAWRNMVALPSTQSVVDANDPATVLRDPATGAVSTVLRRYRNVDRVTTRGADLAFAATAHTELGRWRLGLDATHVASFKEAGAERAGTNRTDFFTSGHPRWRGRIGVEWERRGTVASARMHYTGTYRRELPNPAGAAGATWYQPQDPQFQNGVLPRVPQYRTLDLSVRHAFGPRFSVFASVVNVEDREPPYDPSFPILLFDVGLYDVRGRQVRAGFTWAL